MKIPSGASTVPGRRLESLRERYTGILREDPTSVKEFKKETSNHSCEHEIVLCLPAGGIYFNLVIGMTFSVEHEIVHVKIIGPVYMSFLGWGGLEREGTDGQLRILEFRVVRVYVCLSPKSRARSHHTRGVRRDPETAAQK